METARRSQQTKISQRTWRSPLPISSQLLCMPATRSPTILLRMALVDVDYITANRNDEGVRFPVMDIGMCVCDENCVASSCLNALSKIWCTQENCGAATFCSNQIIQSKSVHLVQTSVGLGVATTAFLESGEMVGEYLGEFTTSTERADGSRYAFQIRKRSTWKQVVYIDASTCGGLARYVNHSCVPNCFFEQYEYLADVRVAIVTQRQIAPGEQLTATYNVGDLRFSCQCGEKTCVAKSRKVQTDSK